MPADADEDDFLRKKGALKAEHRCLRISGIDKGGYHTIATSARLRQSQMLTFVMIILKDCATSLFLELRNLRGQHP